MRDPDFLADCERYGPRALFREQSLWALWVYRFGRRVEQRPPGWRRTLDSRLYWILFRLVETLTGISIPRTVRLGPGVRIWHFGGIFIHHGVVIGRRCTLRQGVTIGNRHGDDDVPTVGDDVEFGAYAQVLGRIRIGNGCRIGAMAVVLADMPDGAVAVGNPARIIESRAGGQQS